MKLNGGIKLTPRVNEKAMKELRHSVKLWWHWHLPLSMTTPTQTTRPGGLGSRWNVSKYPALSFYEIIFKIKFMKIIQFQFFPYARAALLFVCMAFVDEMEYIFYVFMILSNISHFSLRRYFWCFFLQVASELINFVATKLKCNKLKCSSSFYFPNYKNFLAV